MDNTVILTTWVPENPEKWKGSSDETELNDNLGLLMDDFIESRSYMRHMPNGIMLEQDRNISKFLDTVTGEVKCFGYFRTESVRSAVA
jgi:hypothetical protein